MACISPEQSVTVRHAGSQIRTRPAGRNYHPQRLVPNGRHVGRFGDGARGIRVVGKMNESSGVGGATVEY